MAVAVCCVHCVLVVGCGSAVVFADEEGVGVHQASCGCCSGTGRVKDVDVWCSAGQHRRTVHVMEYIRCACNACAQGDKQKHEGTGMVH
jgi:hypothetical protein